MVSYCKLNENNESRDNALKRYEEYYSYTYAKISKDEKDLKEQEWCLKSKEKVKVCSEKNVLYKQEFITSTEVYNSYMS